MKRKFINDLKFSILSQFLSIALGLIRATIIPFYLGVEGFGYWQVYVLYIGLVGVSSLGFIDGIYLNFGGCNERNLPLAKLRSGFVCYLISLFAIAFLAYVAIYNLDINHQKRTALFYVIPNIIMICITSYFSVILQVTNKISKYSKYLLVDKVVFLLFLLMAILIKDIDFEFLIQIDIASRLILLSFLIFNYRQYVLGPMSELSDGILFYFRNISDGVKLLLANMASMFILVVGRIYVENNFNIEDFSLYSFGISITNIVLMAIGAIAVVLYPAIKRVDSSRYGELYRNIDSLFCYLSMAALVLYFPCYYFIEFNMREYSGVLEYLNLLFLICVLQCKMQLLINTYYKVLREENTMLKANVITIFIAITLMAVSSVVSENVYYVILSIFISMYYRVVASESYISQTLKIKGDTINSLIVIMLFLMTTELFSIDVATLLFTLYVLVFFKFNYKKLVSLVEYVK
ncbi:lipopolysaccharide biosynthesis protein [Vibrio sp. PNB22_4_2]